MTDLDRSTTTLAGGGIDGGSGVPDPTGTLCALIADVLGLAAVDPGQSFTGLGGDSIQAIQVVSRARPAGLLVTTREVLRSETVAALAAGARAVGRSGAGTGPARTARRFGPFAPTPIMAWLGELGGPVDTYNQSLVLRTPAGFGTEDAVRVVQALLDTHDILRLRAPGGAGAAGAGAAGMDSAGTEPTGAESTGARPLVPPPGSVDARALIEHVEAGALGDEELPGLVTERVRAARRLLAPAEGIVLRAVRVDRGPARQGRLALIVHHLAVDGVSWRILQDDLRSCWEALAAGRAPEPAPVPTPFAHWAGLLRADATSGRRMAEAARWTDTLRPAPEPLGGVCASDRLDAESAVNRHTLTLPPDVTGPLLTVAPGLVNGTVNDVLLTGLALAVLAWRRPDTGDGDGGSVLVDIEGHGREEITDGVDLSRTVGWFTTMYPVRFDLGLPDLADARAGGPTVGAALRQVKETLRAIPDHGIGYGLLRHGNSRTGPGLAALGIPEIGFNYLGRFPMGDTADWAAAPGHDFALDDADEGLPMAHAVEVNAAAHEGPDGLTLSATWTWAGNAYPADRVRALAEEWFAMLRALARHTALPGAAGLTPSDVSLTGLSQADLDAFESELGDLL
ncbi:non-ribosomal peptide synthase domain TIGR01720 [Streptomyces sp. DconLS]|uniref:condensation domain-containing protein n=1 Tax=Streptomyces sp. LamerLS-31b TaxID=1839765 RepID=UPI00081E14A7|nr:MULTISPECIES: condensation domain-containing protein [unclassified Streptomyces]SCF92603.1 non-ribosomal peptide synthase domain TIGR01720 [Streptomyces sp. DconLS]SCG00028.1 non-ribosomal peptide synthase domain TIGR01720 [Streptomyces sp. LamerLS-31b]